MENAPGRHLAEHGPRRNAGIRTIVAPRAALFVDCFAGGFWSRSLRVERAGRHEEQESSRRAHGRSVAPPVNFQDLAEFVFGVGKTPVSCPRPVTELSISRLPKFGSQHNPCFSSNAAVVPGGTNAQLMCTQ